MGGAESCLYEQEPCKSMLRHLEGFWSLPAVPHALSFIVITLHPPTHPPTHLPWEQRALHPSPKSAFLLHTAPCSSHSLTPPNLWFCPPPILTRQKSLRPRSTRSQDWVLPHPRHSWLRFSSLPPTKRKQISQLTLTDPLEGSFLFLDGAQFARSARLVSLQFPLRATGLFVFHVLVSRRRGADAFGLSSLSLRAPDAAFSEIGRFIVNAHPLKSQV